jgi:DNA-binding response OmpR family regulator
MALARANRRADLVILDAMMPIICGADVLSVLRGERAFDG